MYIGGSVNLNSPLAFLTEYRTGSTLLRDILKSMGIDIIYLREPPMKMKPLLTPALFEKMRSTSIYLHVGDLENIQKLSKDMDVDVMEILSGHKWVWTNRLNVMAQCLSMLNVDVTDKGWLTPHSPENYGKIDQGMIEERMFFVLNHKIKIDDFFLKMGISPLVINYETDLRDSENWQATVQKIFAYAGVSYPLKERTQKLSKEEGKREVLMDILRRAFKA